MFRMKSDILVLSVQFGIKFFWIFLTSKISKFLLKSVRQNTKGGIFGKSSFIIIKNVMSICLLL